jgi:putative ABC transport system ATP-binding protein
VYAHVQATLDTAISDLAGAGAGATNDFFFNNDAAAWTAAAHTLKARFYMHTAEKSDLSYDATILQNVLTETASGIADTGASLETKHSDANLEQNLFYQYYAGLRQGDLAPSQLHISLANQLHDPDVLAIADHVVELERGRNAGDHPAVEPPATHAAGEVVLRKEGLTMSYGGTRALDDETVELRAGELAVVVGLSGSGKSTLLMLLGGWLGADDGAPSWADVAYVPQRFGLVPELTVRENVDLPGRLGRVEAATADLLERLALAELKNRFPAELSIGQQQRVAVARALSLRPHILLVDEPTSHQDAASAERVWALLAWAAEQGTACFVATHEPDARRRAHTSWEIEGGRLSRS